MEITQTTVPCTGQRQKRPTVRRVKLTRREKDTIMRDLGLTKVRGAVSGKVYYE